MATTQEIFGHHLDSFGELDLDEVMKDYDDNSTVITMMGVAKGTEQIRQTFGALFEEFGKPGMSFEMLADPVIEGEAVYIQWKAETADNNWEYVTDTFVVRDDKIAIQTVGGVVTPKA